MGNSSNIYWLLLDSNTMPLSEKVQSTIGPPRLQYYVRYGLLVLWGWKRRRYPLKGQNPTWGETDRTIHLCSQNFSTARWIKAWIQPNSLIKFQRRKMCENWIDSDCILNWVCRWQWTSFVNDKALSKLRRGKRDRKLAEPCSPFDIKLVRFAASINLGD